MSAVHDALRLAFGIVLGPLGALPPFAGLAIASALAGVALLFAFRWTSNPAAIRGDRRRVQAHLLAIRLYREDLGVVMRAEARLVASLGRYVGRMLRPFAALLLPFALLFAHLDARYSSRALHPGERALIKLFADPSTAASWRLEADAGVAVDSPPVRIPSRGEIAWRIRADAVGRSAVRFVADGRRVTTDVVVSAATVGAPTTRMAGSVASLFLAPSEPAIDGPAAVRKIEIAYPPLAFEVLRWRIDWIVVFLVVSAIVAIALRRRAGVEFW